MRYIKRLFLLWYDALPVAPAVLPHPYPSITDATSLQKIALC